VVDQISRGICRGFVARKVNDCLNARIEYRTPFADVSDMAEPQSVRMNLSHGDFAPCNVDAIVVAGELQACVRFG